MWRPNGWMNPIPIVEPVPDTYPTGSAYHNHLLFEAGADAMLKGLAAQAKGHAIFIFQKVNSKEEVVYITGSIYLKAMGEGWWIVTETKPHSKGESGD